MHIQNLQGYAIIKQSSIYNDFGLAELSTYCKISNCQNQVTQQKLQYYPMCHIEDLQNDFDHIKNLVQKLVFVKHILIALAEGSSIDDLILVQWGFAKEYINSNQLTMRIEIISIKVKIDQLQQRGLINLLLKKLKINNKIDLINPQVVYFIICTEKRIFIGLQPWSGIVRKQVNNYSKFLLADRVYLGPVALPHELAFVMCNIAKVQEGDFVLDPFCGSCSILVAATQLGAYSFGCEIEKDLLFGDGMGVLNVKSSYYKQGLDKPYIKHNFNQYGLEVCDVLVMDGLVKNGWREGVFDSVICDPPFGIRASQNGINDIYSELLCMSERVLKDNGILVHLMCYEGEQMNIEQIIYSNETMRLKDYRVECVSKGRYRIMCCLQKKIQNNIYLIQKNIF